MRIDRSLGVFTLVAVVLVAGYSARGAVLWATPNGTNVNFDYANGNTDNQLFVPAATNPIVTPAGLAFFPSNFRADAANGSAEVVSDTLRFEIHAKPTKELVSFIVNEFGDYSILGSGPNTAVKASGGLFLTNMDTFQVLFTTLNTTPVPLNTATGITSGQGAWTGTQTLINIPSGWTNVQVVLDNALHAGSDTGTSTFIEKKVVTQGLEIIVVLPEPGSIGFALISSAMLLVRRGRRQLIAV